MTLHLIKLCVGCDSIEDLAEWIEQQARRRRAAPAASPSMPTSPAWCRNAADELLDGGSLYWVIKGNVQVRQRLLDIRVFTDGEGIQRCRLVLDQTLAPTEWQPKRPFQGWRYL